MKNQIITEMVVLIFTMMSLDQAEPQEPIAISPSGELVGETDCLIIVCSNTKTLVDLDYIIIEFGLN